jgi:hypothetical protein
MNAILVNILCGIAGGLVVLAIQEIINYWKKQSEERQKLSVGDPDLKILDRDFLFNYEPGEISIEKIIGEFGTANRIETYSDSIGEINSYFYVLENAKLIFTTLNKQPNIISVTVFSTKNQKYPVICRQSFEDDEEIFGKAKLTDSILRDNVSIENYESIHEQTTVIKSRFFYRQIRHLYFSYSIDGHFEKLVDANGQLIQQVCISEVESICPMLNFFDTFYN